MTKLQKVEEFIRKTYAGFGPTGSLVEYNQNITDDSNGNLIPELRNRSLNLDDVLMALISVNLEFEVFCMVVGEVVIKIHGIGHCDWNLTKPLHLQEPPLIEFLYDIFYPQNKDERK